MEISGYVTEDTPDPLDQVRQRVESLGIAAAGLVPQPHLDDGGALSLSESRREDEGGPEVLEEVTLARTYTLWRNPDDRADPANLAELDAALQESLDRPPERPMPGWLLAARQLLRYPRLWEAVQTHWTAPGVEARPAAERLVSHAEYVLHNMFRRELGLADGDHEWRSLVPVSAVQPRGVVVDGAERPGLLIDTDPLVLALGTTLDDGRVVTVVVPRDELPLVRLELASDLPIR